MIIINLAPGTVISGCFSGLVEFGTKFKKIVGNPTEPTAARGNAHVHCVLTDGLRIAVLCQCLSIVFALDNSNGPKGNGAKARMPFQ